MSKLKLTTKDIKNILLAHLNDYSTREIKKLLNLSVSHATIAKIIKEHTVKIFCPACKKFWRSNTGGIRIKNLYTLQTSSICEKCAKRIFAYNSKYPR